MVCRDCQHKVRNITTDVYRVLKPMWRSRRIDDQSWALVRSLIKKIEEQVMSKTDRIFRFFDFKEFDCKCGCGKNNMDLGFLIRLDVARSIAGVAFVITSGARCEKHNKDVGSTSDNHIKGSGADIRVQSSFERFRVVYGLVSVGLTRIGVYDTWIHVDMNDTAPVQEALWL